MLKRISVTDYRYIEGKMLNLKEFKDIEREFCSTYGLEVKQSSVIDKYVIDTVFGEYSLWFDKSKPFAIFGRFSDPDKIKESSLGVNVNHYTGKMNFHGELNILLFTNVMMEFKIGQ